MNIYQRLVEVRKKIDYLKKENKGSQYAYVSSSQVLANIKKELDIQGLLLIPNIVNANVKEHTTKNGTLSFFTELTIKYIWINIDKPDEKIEVQFYAQGVDLAGEKGVGKALTYAEKYFLLKSFNIATDKDDPDAFQSKHKEKEKINYKKELGNMLVEMFGKNNAAAELEKYTEFRNKDKIVSGVKELNQLSDKRTQVTFGIVKKDYLIWKQQKEASEDIF